jgi:hypothetical protein
LPRPGHRALVARTALTQRCLARIRTLDGPGQRHRACTEKLQDCSSVLEPHRDATTRRVEPENVAPAIAIEVAGPRAHPVRTDVAASSATNGHTAPNGFQSIPKVEIGLDAWYEATSFEVEAAAVRRLNKAALGNVVYPPFGSYLRHFVWLNGVAGVGQGPRSGA